MKFLANENFPYPSVIELRQAGYDVKSILDISPSISDEEIMQIAINENRTILTFDRDYGELIFKMGINHRQVLSIFDCLTILRKNRHVILLVFLINSIALNLFLRLLMD